MPHLSAFSLKPLSGSNSHALKSQTPPAAPACSLVTTHASWRDSIPLLLLPSRLLAGGPWGSLPPALQSLGLPEHHRGQIQDDGTPVELVMEGTLPSHPPGADTHG